MTRAPAVVLAMLLGMLTKKGSVYGHRSDKQERLDRVWLSAARDSVACG